MKREKQVRRMAFCTALCYAVVSLAVFPMPAKAQEADDAYTEEELCAVAEGIINWKKQEEGIGEDGYLLSGALLEQAGSSAGDWYAMALGRLGIADDYESYLAVLEDNVETRYQKQGGLDGSKATEWQRIGLAALAAGGDPTDFGTDENGQPINLVADGSYDRGKTAALNAQGMNGLVWGLLLMDSMRYVIPEGAADTRDTVIQALLEMQNEDGGFSLMQGDSMADMTAMTLQALAPYYNSPQVYSLTDGAGESEEKSVRQAAEEALQWLAGQQETDGSFGQTAGSETVSQTVIALCALGIHPEKDERFIKDGATLLDGLMTFAQEDGGFVHSREYDVENPVSSPEESNSMAGEQALCAIVSVLRLQKDMRSFYDFRPEMAEEQKEQIRELEAGIDMLKDLQGQEQKEQAETLFAAYLEIPVWERSYVSDYGVLADVMKEQGISDTSENIAGAEGENTSGFGAVTDVLGTGEAVVQGEFGRSDEEKYQALAGEASTEQYTTVVSLLQKLEKSENAEGYAGLKEELEKRKEEIEHIQEEIEALNAEVLEKLYPLEKLSLSDRDAVHSILERIDRLTPYDRGQVLRYEDIRRAAVQVDNLQRAVWIGAALGIAVLIAAVIIIIRIKKRRAEKRAFYRDEEDDE